GTNRALYSQFQGKRQRFRLICFRLQLVFAAPVQRRARVRKGERPSPASRSSAAACRMRKRNGAGEEQQLGIGQIEKTAFFGLRTLTDGQLSGPNGGTNKVGAHHVNSYSVSSCHTGRRM